MIRVSRSQPAPESLAVQKHLAAGRYNCDDVVLRLKADFFNKCYLCGESHISAVEVDHLRPHGDSPDLKFAWDNLFYSCRHCNGIKSNRYWPVLDCTAPEVPVLVLLLYCVEYPDVRTTVRVESQVADEAAVKTAQLLTEIFDSKTTTRRVEAANILKKIRDDCEPFRRRVSKYKNATEEQRKRLRRRIAKELAPETSFTAIRAWEVIKCGHAQEFRAELERLGYEFSRSEENKY